MAVRVKSEVGGDDWNSGVESGAVKPAIADMLALHSNTIGAVRVVICVDTPDCEPERIW